MQMNLVRLVSAALLLVAPLCGQDDPARTRQEHDSGISASLEPTARAFLVQLKAAVKAAD
jgi:hypothetical protein